MDEPIKSTKDEANEQATPSVANPETDTLANSTGNPTKTSSVGAGEKQMPYAPPARDTLINKVLAGRYELLEMLGEGPLLAAYRSRDKVANRLVTVKTVKLSFTQETEILADLRSGLSRTLSLAHPNIARVFDVGTDNETGRLFLAEEYVRGIDLKERIRRVAPFQLTAATDTAIAIVEALEAAHERGLAHGDMRPQNILIGPDGQVKVTGFGSAAAQTRVVVRDSNLFSRVVGYIAPDAARAAAPTPSADLYAVGVILYEMLTGDMPYSAETPVQVALKHAQDPIPSPRQLNIGVPVALDGIVRKALGKAPEERYANATALLKDLRAVRDALKYGKSLSWSPLDPAYTPVSTRPVEKSPNESANAQPPTVPAVPPMPVRSTAVVPPVSAVVGEAEAGESDAEGTDIMPNKRGKKAVEPPVYEDEPPRSSGVGRIFTFINLLLALVLVGAVGYLIYKTLPLIQPSGEVVVPELVNKKLVDAETMALEKNFKLEIVARDYRESEAKDVIYQQSIAPGRRIKEGKAIGIWVSQGPRMATMPDVKSMSVEKARRLLESRGLRLDDPTYEYDPWEPKGNVIRQAPQPDENVARGTRVKLVLSKGEEPVATPSPIPTAPPLPEFTPYPEPTPTPKPRERYFKVAYDVPDDGGLHRVRIDIFDAEGPRTVFDEEVKAGTKLIRQGVRTVGNTGEVTIKVFDNDVLEFELVK